MVSVNDDHYKTKILEFEKECYSIHKPLHIIEKSCLRFGATLAGRKRAAEQILRTKSMLPAPIKPLYGLYMFPILSERNESSVWLAYYAIKDFKAKGKHAAVYFTDGTVLDVAVSVRVLDNQRKKTAQVIAGMVNQLFLSPEEG